MPLPQTKTHSIPDMLCKIKAVIDGLRDFSGPTQSFNLLNLNGSSECALPEKGAGKKMLKMKSALDELLKKRGQKECSGWLIENKWVMSI